MNGKKEYEVQYSKSAKDSEEYVRAENIMIFSDEK